MGMTPPWIMLAGALGRLVDIAVGIPALILNVRNAFIRIQKESELNGRQD
jgi:hypothetical protein